MDYLSAELPCVLGRGDETARGTGRRRLRDLVGRPEPDDLVGALLALADDPGAMSAARAAGHALAAERHWAAVGSRLRRVVGEAFERLDEPRSPSLTSVAGAGAF